MSFLLFLLLNHNEKPQNILNRKHWSRVSRAGRRQVCVMVLPLIKPPFIFTCPAALRWIPWINTFLQVVIKVSLAGNKATSGINLALITSVSNYSPNSYGPRLIVIKHINKPDRLLAPSVSGSGLAAPRWESAANNPSVFCAEVNMVRPTNKPLYSAHYQPVMCQSGFNLTLFKAH